jgi:6-hydroxynicotinate 3-monooxygenase
VTKPSFAVVGAGIGGLAVAAFLDRQGIEVTVYEQAGEFLRIGAGIQMSPNAMRVLRALELEPRLRKIGFQTPSWANRVWDTGEPLFELTLGESAEQRYGAPYLLLHRGDLHAALLSAVSPQRIRFGKKLVGIERRGAVHELRFADESRALADAVIGADGVHSRVREILLGPEQPRFIGRVAFRTVFPTALMQGVSLETCTKWWGPDRHIIMYPVNARRDETYFTTAVPDPDWDIESWSAQGDVAEAREAFVGFHGDVQTVLAACPRVHKWALFERDPLPRWGEGAVVLLGDACHPMTPYMAQGAASALEDAAMLSRCVAALSDAAEAFRRYQATRLERASRLQLTSRENSWGRHKVDPDWVYGYDVWRTPIFEPAPSARAAAPPA